MLLSKFMLFNGTQKQITLIARGNTLIHSGIHDLHFRSSKIRLYEIILILNIFEMQYVPSLNLLKKCSLKYFSLV